MKAYWISYKITGNEHYCDDITWSCRITAPNVAEAVNILMDIEKRYKITKFVDIREVQV